MTVAELQDLLIKAIDSNDPKIKGQFEYVAKKALQRDPDKWDLNMLLGTFYVHEKDPVGIPLLIYASRQNPKSSEIMNNLGNAYRQNYHYKQAMEWFNRALKRNPKDADIYTNMGTIHVNEGRPDVAEKYLRKALECGKADKKAYWNLALALLEQEKFEEGFDKYAYGLVSGDRKSKSYLNAPWWDGRAHKGSVVVYGEQGLGDEIMWASCIEEIRPYFERVIIDCHPRLEGLFKRSFPWATVYPTRKILDPDNAGNDWIAEERPKYRVAMADLPRFFRRKESDFRKVAYLTPDRERVEEYRHWIKLLGGKPVGLSWVGGTHDTRADLRSLTLDGMMPILQCLDANFISCQYTSDNRDVSKVREGGIPIYDFPEVFEARKWERWEVVDANGETCAMAKDKDAARHFIAQYGGEIKHHPGPGYDFDETAAFVTAIQEEGGFVVSVNNTLVHLCGALGVDCRVLTPAKPAWRYGLKREGMVWYGPWIKQYRQGKDWSSAMNRLIEDVTENKNAA